jgi:hypothetical protein
MSSRFVRYQRSVGIEELRDDGRSKVNLHLFRKWFTTKARHASIPTHVVDDVTGHKHEGMTLSVYYGGATDDMRRACVASVRLPGALNSHRGSTAMAEQDQPGNEHGLKENVVAAIAAIRFVCDQSNDDVIRRRAYLALGHMLKVADLLAAAGAGSLTRATKGRPAAEQGGLVNSQG